MRDDLDPCAPPAEYADGQISWSGYPSREARDAGRVAEEMRRREAAAAEVRRRQEVRRRAEARLRAETLARIARCDHSAARETGEPRGFVGPIARPGEENRAAHGNTQVTDCCPCGASRQRLVNQRHQEVGPWFLDEDRLQGALDRRGY
jgi:hypothetical protein